MGNKGFTLVEVLAVITIVAVLGLIAIPGVIGTISRGRDNSYQIMVANVKSASISLFEEIEYGDGMIYQYHQSGQTSQKITISSNQITVNLQSLVSNGFLQGMNNPSDVNDQSVSNKNDSILINPRNNEDIGTCQILIKKIVDINGRVNYQFRSLSSNSSCPKTSDYS